VATGVGTLECSAIKRETERERNALHCCRVHREGEEYSTFGDIVNSEVATACAPVLPVVSRTDVTVEGRIKALFVTADHGHVSPVPAFGGLEASTAVENDGWPDFSTRLRQQEHLIA
jgi:hypothetical protein